MQFLWFIFGIAAALLLTVLLLAYICYRMAFYVPNRPKVPSDAIDIPEGEIYEPYREKMEDWTRAARTMPHEDMSVTSFDGLTLRGKYYEFAPGAPIELMFPGYRGTAERDLSGGVQRCFELGHSALIVNQRASADSDGNVISFGVNEHRDCLTWVAHMCRRFGPDVKIILTGISMGAATVLMAGGCDLPENVIGILADCGYNRARDIIRKVIRQLRLPVAPSYFFVKLGAKLFGHFDLEETSPEEQMARCRVPVIFFHGEADDFVPCWMSQRNYDACASRKQIVTVPDAGHGLCYPVAPERYLSAVREFFNPVVSAEQEQK